MIVLYLKGRIGNQLFMYSMAEAVRQKRNRKELIAIYDKSVVVDWHWENSLPNYNLQNVIYIHEYKDLPPKTKKQLRIIGFINKFLKRVSFNNRLRAEKVLNPLLSKLGIISCENGYFDYHCPVSGDVLLYGYFQSEKYFEDYKEIVRKQLYQDLSGLTHYNDLISKLSNRNSVCITIKVEDNVGNSMFNVCGLDYYRQAINEIEQRVDDPLFFICSDNVQFVLDHLIDVSRYEYYCQPKDLPVHKSLAMMSLCNNFIISNSTFSWWAQYLCERSNKTVYAPNRWMRIDMPIDLYDKHWKLIDVTSYINKSLK